MKAGVGGGIVYLLVIVMTLLMRISGSVGVYDALGVDPDIFFTLVVQLCIFGLLPVLGWAILVGRCEKDDFLALPRTFGVVKCSKRNLIRTLVITIPVLLLTGVMSSAWNAVLAFIGFERTPSSASEQTVTALVSDILLSAVLPGIFEELTHRGELFAAYRDRGWKVIVVSALLFSLMHQNIPQTGHTFVIGLCLACLTYYTGSVLPAMFVHFFNNFISIASGYAGVVPVFGVIGTVSSWLNGTVLGVVVLSALALASVAVIVVVFARMRADAVREGRLPVRQFEPASAGALPLHKDIVLWAVVAIGVAATAFSFVWGMV